MTSSEPLAGGAEAAPGYEVIAHLSRGRRLDVYDAWSHERGCRCVLKAIRPERAHEETAREQLLFEGRLLERLGHPHLVRAYETLLEPTPTVVLETLAGQTLAHMIEDEERELTPADLAHLGLHLGSAMRYLHRNGFLHLDLKPSNIVAESGQAKVIDLSLARAPGPAPAGIGTWCYLSPEQAAGDELGSAADVWGIGIVLFEAATHKPAFDEPDDLGDEEPSATGSDDDSLTDESLSDDETWGSDDRGEVDYPQLSEPAPLVGSMRDLPPALAELIDACLRRDPGARPSVEQLLAGLEPFAELPDSERRWEFATSFTNLDFGPGLSRMRSLNRA